MAAQNILSIGVDVATFTQEKKVLLEQYIALFDKLSKYDGKKINVISGAGLTEFNSSVKETSKLLSDMNEKIKAIEISQNKSTSSTKNSSKAKKEENEILKQTKALKEQAIKDSAKFSAALTKEGEAAAKAKAELKELQKEMMEEARAQTESYKARIRAIEQKKQEAIANKKISDDAKKVAKDQADADKKAARDKAALDRQASADAKKKTAELKAELDKQTANAQRQQNSLLMLKERLAKQQVNYANTVQDTGIKSDASKAALADVTATQAQINTLNANMRAAGSEAERFGSALTKGLSTVRTLAYILPGIGIAGLFNLAFQAIGSAIDGLEIFNNSLLKQFELQEKINQSLVEQANKRKEIYEYARDLNNELNKNSSLNKGRNIDIMQSLGFSTDILDPARITAAARAVNEAKSKIIPGDENFTKRQIEQAIRLQRLITNFQDEINQPGYEKSRAEKASKAIQKDWGALGGQFAPRTWVVNAITNFTELGEEGIKRLKTELAVYTTDIQEKVSNYKNLKEREADLENLIAEEIKKKDDEKRERRIAYAKDEASKQITQNERILSSELSSEKTQLNALEKIYKSKKETARLEYENIERNNSSTQNEKNIAFSNLEKTNFELKNKYEEDYNKKVEEFRQRRLSAQLSIDKDEVEKSALKNERIYKDDTNTIEERLTAYSVYISKKQTLDDLEYARQIDVLALKNQKDPTVQLERKQLESEREQQKASKQADVERQTYEIVYSSLQKQLKAIKDENETEGVENERKYKEELIKLNTSYENKTISYKKYKDERFKLDEKYRRSEADEDIKDDKADLARLNVKKKILLENLEANKRELSEAEGYKAISDMNGGDNSLAADKGIATAVGKKKATEKAISDIDVEIKSKEEKLGKDELKKEQNKYKEKIDYTKQYADEAKKILDAYLDYEKAVRDAQAEVEKQRIRDTAAVRNEAIQDELSAIEKSSLSLKNKQALSIQLNAQKKEADKKDALEIKKIEREKAIFDRGINMAKIALNIAEAITAALTIPPPAGEIIAAERGAAGLIQLATAAAVQIPSYAEGTENHPGGLARYGEDGVEIVKEPYKSPYYVLTETIGYLPKGTSVTPIEESPEFKQKIAKDESWEQFRYLAKQMKKNKSEIKNTIVNNVKIDLGFELYKNKILNGKA